MGYELHITRENNSPIQPEEWKAIVDSDTELELDPDNGEHFARFFGECEYGRGQGWFDLQLGQISTKYPDNALLAKMLEIAEQLDAMVAGDDGEIYTEPDITSGKQPQVEEEPIGTWAAIKDIFYYFFPPKNVTALPFNKGDRVTDGRREGVVIAIKRRAMGGLGSIDVRFEDGAIIGYAIDTHGLEKIVLNK